MNKYRSLMAIYKRVQRPTHYPLPTTHYSLSSLAVLLLLPLTLILASVAHAQGTIENNEVPPTADECNIAINKALAKEQRLYRVSLFGRKKAEDEPVGSVRFDDDGWAYYKTKKNRWFSPAQLQEDGRFQNDRGMDQVSEKDSIPVEEGGMDLSPQELPRRGIFETKRVLSSEIVPHLTQAMRAFACRTAMVCYRVERSATINRNNPDADKELVDGKIPIHVHGCLHPNWEFIEECAFTEKGGSPLDQITSIQHCQDASAGMLQREGEILRMLVEYDAAYRSLLQFAGIFDEFLLEFRWTMVGSLRQAASIIGWLGRIPCFVGACDEYPPTLNPNDDVTH